jgi:DNA-binding NarL/FixJ family response regulator
MKILICDDHKAITENIKEYLDRYDQFEFTGEAQNINEAVKIMKNHAIDLAIVDLDLEKEDGFDLIDLIHQKSPSTKVLVFTSYKPELYGIKALKAGVHGYITKAQSIKTFPHIIEQIMNGDFYCTQEFINLMAVALKDTVLPEKGDVLNCNEKQCIKLMAEGCSINVIADKLNTSDDNVYKIQKSIVRKLKLKDKNEIVPWWHKNKPYQNS